MSYDISLCDPVTHEPLKADSTHFIAGGMRAMGGTKACGSTSPIITVTSIINRKCLGMAASVPSMAKQAQKAFRCLKRPSPH